MDVQSADSGMHAVAMLKKGIDDVEFCAELAKIGIVARRLSPYYATKPAKHGLILGFAAVPMEGLRVGVERLVSVARNY